jgi:hypothetical protein
LGLKRDLNHDLDDYNDDGPHHGRLTRGRIPRRDRLRARHGEDEIGSSYRHNSLTAQGRRFKPGQLALQPAYEGRQAPI